MAARKMAHESKAEHVKAGRAGGKAEGKKEHEKAAKSALHRKRVAEEVKEIHHHHHHHEKVSHAEAEKRVGKK